MLLYLKWVWSLACCKILTNRSTWSSRNIIKYTKLSRKNSTFIDSAFKVNLLDSPPKLGKICHHSHHCISWCKNALVNHHSDQKTSVFFVLSFSLYIIEYSIYTYIMIHNVSICWFVDVQGISTLGCWVDFCLTTKTRPGRVRLRTNSPPSGAGSFMITASPETNLPKTCSFCWLKLCFPLTCKLWFWSELKTMHTICWSCFTFKDTSAVVPKFQATLPT